MALNTAERSTSDLTVRPLSGSLRAATTPTVGRAKPRRRAEKAPLSTRQSASTKNSKRRGTVGNAE